MAKRSLTGGGIAVSEVGTTDDILKPSSTQTRSRIAIESIKDRVHGDLRALDPRHVFELADSVAVINTTSPITVDKRNHLLTGGHRRAALRLIILGDTSFVPDAQLLDKLYTQDRQEIYAAGKERYFADGTVKVYIDDLDPSDEQYYEKAKAVEVAENTRRKGLKREEIRAIAQKLNGIEFVHIRKGGRLTGGKKSLKSHLALITGVSEKTVQRALNEDVEEESGLKIQQHLQPFERVNSSILRTVKTCMASDETKLSDETLLALDQVCRTLDALAETGEISRVSQKRKDISKTVFVDILFPEGSAG